MATKAKLDRIEMDTSIQCRAAIDTAVVTEYAERMKAGDVFPPVTLFGESDCRLNIGDGWHRIMAARQNGADVIEADIRKGGRSDALKHALGANALHGHRRTNADKRRCVEIALAEFGNMSSRAIAEMCGVGHHLVLAIRPDVGDSPTSAKPATRTDTLGRQQPAKRTTPDSRLPTPERTTATPPQGTDKDSRKPTQRGTNADWVSLNVAAAEVRKQLALISTLCVDSQHKIPARMVCESLSEEFGKAAQKLVK